MDEELTKNCKEISRASYIAFKTGDDSQFWSIVHQLGGERALKCIRLNNNRYKRVSRIRDKIGEAVRTGRCLFLTLTFTNDVLDSTSVETRRKYVRRFLREVSSTYVANIDFGSQNGREHYHAVVVADSVQSGSWQYGAMNFKKIHTDKKDLDCTAKYITKLSSHAIKESTGHLYRVIFSRNV